MSDGKRAAARGDVGHDRRLPVRGVDRVAQLRDGRPLGQFDSAG